MLELGLPAGVDSTLGKRLATLTFLRLVVLALLLVIIEVYYLRALSFGGFSTTVAVSTVAISFLLSAVFTVGLRMGKQLDRIAYAQLVTDQLAWTALVYISGGVTSGSTSLYGLTCVSGAVLIGTAGATWAAVVGVLSYLSLCFGFAYGVLPVPPDQATGGYVVDLEQMVYPAFSTIVATALVASLATYLSERLRMFGGQLKVAEKRAEAAERLAALGRLSAALAHEIRNPLGSIRGSIELMRTGSDLSDEDNKLCKIIEREAARLNDLVTDMVDLGRPREPERVEMDLPTIATSVVELAKRSARGEGLRIDYQGPSHLLVRADPAQMRQVLWNLVRNAMQASVEDSEVIVSVQRDEDGGVVMSVHDEGRGIPSSKREQIFDAFFTTRSHGVGIGLAVVKQVADAHGFGIDVDSTGDEGTTFSLRIPKTSVLASVALVLTALACGGLGCGGQDWVRDEPDVWWGDDAPVEVDPVASAPERAPADAPGDAPALTASGTPAQPGVEKYRNTYYDFPQEGASTSDKKKLFDAKCTLIREVPAQFHDAVCVQGSGRLASGETVSFNRRDCECASECPRTAQKICFDVLERKRFPYGRGASGTAITPLRSVAVDVDVIPLGTVLYIPEYHGLRRSDGSQHDGCFLAEDRGLKVKGRHVDLFTGLPETTESWNNAVPSNTGVTVIIGAARCDYLRKR